MTASSRRLRIGFISQWYDPEKGSAVTPGVQARALASLGHSVEVLTGWPHYPSGTLDKDFAKRPFKREQHGDIVVHRVPEYPTHQPSAAGRMATYLSFAATAAAVAPRVLRHVDVTLVHSTPATAAIPAMALRATRHTPFVLHIQDLWPDTVLASGFAGRVGSHMASALHRFCDATYRQAWAIAVTAPSMADAIRERGVPDRKLAFAPNWADEAVFRPVVPNHTVAAEVGLPTDGFTIMYAGNVGHIQGLDLVLDAAARLRERPDIHFAIVGSGVARDGLHARAKEQGLERVHFIDAQPFTRMGELLALGDAQLISFVDKPLFHLTLPSKLQATLAAGRPVIGAVTGDAAKVIEVSQAGTVVAPGDGAGLASTAVAMADAPGSTAALGHQARTAYERDFSEATSVRRLEELLLRAAAAKGRP